MNVAAPTTVQASAPGSTAPSSSPTPSLQPSKVIPFLSRHCQAIIHTVNWTFEMKNHINPFGHFLDIPFICSCKVYPKHLECECDISLLKDLTPTVLNYEWTQKHLNIIGFFVWRIQWSNWMVDGIYSITGCETYMDIVIVLDGSNSIYPWYEVQDFIINVLQKFYIGPGQTQVCFDVRSWKSTCFAN